MFTAEEIKIMIRNEMIERMKKHDFTLRPKVIINDKQYPLKSYYPHGVISRLLNHVASIEGKIVIDYKNEKTKGQEHKAPPFYVKEKTGAPYAEISFIREYDGYNIPIIFFLSQLPYELPKLKRK